VNPWRGRRVEASVPVASAEAGSRGEVAAGELMQRPGGTTEEAYEEAGDLGPYVGGPQGEKSCCGKPEASGGRPVVAGWIY
jgi:hypothetical protein